VEARTRGHDGRYIRGTDAVFDALDLNGDGCITAEEMGAGLGAAFRLQ
jgi:EF hand